jgi:hypothetical protein
MHDEHLEHELFLLKEKPVILVQPSYGHVSISYAGVLHVVNDIPVIFHFCSNSGDTAIIFCVEDVKGIERGMPSTVIRLKGPHEYREKYDFATGD